MSEPGAPASPQPFSDEAYRKAADRLHGRDGEVEIDDDAKISQSPDAGVYVQAWVWVYDDDVTAEDRA
jgi:hypothetical protein